MVGRDQAREREKPMGKGKATARGAMAAVALAIAAPATAAEAGRPAGGLENPVEALGGGDLPPGRTDGVEHVFLTGAMAGRALVRRDGRADMLAFRDPAPAIVEDVPEGGTCWADEARDGRVTFHLRSRGQAA